MLILQLTVVLLLILLNGFFAMAEIALVSARTARLKALAEIGNPGARAALDRPSSAEARRRDPLAGLSAGRAPPAVRRAALA
jgi:CBS domain containing-hemolysin-like protein